MFQRALSPLPASGDGDLLIEEYSFGLGKSQNIEIKNGFVAGYIGYASDPLTSVLLIGKFEDGQYTELARSTGQFSSFSYANGVLSMTRVTSSSYGGGRIYAIKTD